MSRESKNQTKIEKKIMSRSRYWKIFKAMFTLSAFTIGGGYAIVSLMRVQFVEELGWLEEEEMLNLTAIAQSSPGAVAVNAAILVGYKVAGMSGAIISVVGTILPPLLMVSVISLFYDAFRQNGIVSAVLKGMQAGVVAVIFNVVIDLSGEIAQRKEYVSLVIVGIAFIATYCIGINILYIILSCAGIGILSAWIGVRKELKV